LSTAAAARTGNPVRAVTAPVYRRRMAVPFVSRFPVDDAVVSALHARAFGAPAGAVRPWRQRLDRYALTWVGAFDDGELVGFVQVCWDGGAHAFLLDTAVDPAWRRRGIGTGLVRVATADATAAGCEWLHVDFAAHLARFYLNDCGFRPTAAGLLRLGPETASSDDISRPGSSSPANSSG
jgi:GNAT superfamily N-acetyltransferase